MLTMVFIMALSGLAGCAALIAAFEIAAAISRGPLSPASAHEMASEMISSSPNC